MTRDVWLSNVGAEADGNNGGSPRLKVKSHQEMSLIDFDPAPLRGRTVLAATLHVTVDGEEILRRVTVGGVGSEWVEGDGTNYAPLRGAATFNHSKHPDTPWSPQGGDLCTVIFGQAGTTWRMAGASPPDASKRQSIPIDPEVIAARAAGLTGGLIVFDDTGTEWTRQGERFERRLFPNRFFFSRESRKEDAPYLTVVLGPPDQAAPPAPVELKMGGVSSPAGEPVLSWVTPRDAGPAGTIGFRVEVDGRPVARAAVPAARQPGHRVTIPMRAINARAGRSVRFTVRAVDGAGNVGPAAEMSTRIPLETAALLPKATASNSPPKSGLPKLGVADVAILDELDKVQPVTGAITPPAPEGYAASNHLWSAGDRTIHLAAARNEFVAFQVRATTTSDLKATLKLPSACRARVEFGRYVAVASKSGRMPDPIVPLGGSIKVPTPGATSQSLHVELYVPHDAPSGEHKGVLSLRSGSDSLDLPVVLRVWNFTLPDALSFLPEMNAYGLPANERDYYRLAHRHRTVLNRLPYHQNGGLAEGGAPKWDGRSLDWSEWDRRFGPLLDGSAFSDMPRKGVPLECFYLPIHENWPTPIEGNYNGDYWADRAFPDRYWRDLMEVSRGFAEHFHAKGWHDTLFEAFLNNKVDFKLNGWSRGSSPWLLDEPASFQDFWALRQFGIAIHGGFAMAKGNAKTVYRCDISRPEWQRDSLDGLLDVNVVGGAMRRYRRMVLDRRSAEGQVVIEYGAANSLDASNVQPLAWCVDAWSLGVDGVLPWQTIGSAESWTRADELSLFYPGREPSDPGPYPSVRLKAFRRGQQDVEYLTLWTALDARSRAAVGEAVRGALGLTARRSATETGGAEDAGRVDYGRLRPEAFHALRQALGGALSDAHPEPKRRLVDFRPPRRDPRHLPSRYVGERDEEQGGPSAVLRSLGKAAR